MKCKATLLIGDVRNRLSDIKSASVDCVVTSPPYLGLRDYGAEGQIGLERTPEEYVAELVKVFCEVKRVLKDEGTVWLNLGDSDVVEFSFNIG
jgi:DNA modification methylase